MLLQRSNISMAVFHPEQGKYCLPLDKQRLQHVSDWSSAIMNAGKTASLVAPAFSPTVE